MTDRIENLQNFLIEDPDDHFSRYALALEYQRLGDDTKAAELFSYLLEHVPDYLAAYYQYGKLLEKQQNAEKAAHIFKMGIAIAQKQGNGKTKRELESALSELSDDE